MQCNILTNTEKAETAGWSFENLWLVDNRREHKYLPVFERAQAGGARRMGTLDAGGGDFRDGLSGWPGDGRAR